MQFRKISDKQIAKTHKGILRVSPDENNADNGLLDEYSIVSDSDGNATTISLKKEGIKLENLDVHGLKFNGTATVPTTPPTNGDILVGDQNGNYTLKNIVDLLVEQGIYQALVPIGTVYYNAMKTADINNLPQSLREYYLIPIGQTLSKTAYPDLFNLIGYTYGGSGTNFKLPNLQNKFIRSNGPDETLTNEGSYTVGPNNIGSVQAAQTNPYILDAMNNHRHYMVANDGSIQAWQSLRYAISPNHLNNGHTWGGSTSAGSRLDLNSYFCSSSLAEPNAVRTSKAIPSNGIIPDAPSAKETKPYNIVLVPLMKVK